MLPIGSLLLALALLLVVGLFVVRPLFFAPASAAQVARSRREQLEAEKEQILAQLRALDFDFETGKLPDEEYRKSRESLLAAAAALLQEIDSLAPAAPARTEESLDEVEAAIARRRQQRAAADIEAAVAQRRAQVQPVASRQPVAMVAGNGQGSEPGASAFCPRCGQPHDSGDRFCAFCGQQLD